MRDNLAVRLRTRWKVQIRIWYPLLPSAVIIRAHGFPL